MTWVERGAKQIALHGDATKSARLQVWSLWVVACNDWSDLFKFWCSSRQWIIQYLEHGKQEIENYKMVSDKVDGTWDMRGISDQIRIPWDMGRPNWTKYYSKAQIRQQATV
jgi:hypothetical protein